MRLRWLGARPRPGIVIAGALAVLALGMSLAIGVTAVVRTASGADGVSPDFLSFYTAGEMVRTGDGARLFDADAQAAAQRAAYPGEIEEPIGYPLPVVAAWLFAPFSMMPFGAAYSAWLAVNAGALGAACALLWRVLRGVPAWPRAVFVAAAATSLPAVATLAFGQVDVLVLALLVGAWLMLRAGHPVAAGALLAGCVLKPQFAAGVVLLLVVWREWRALASFAASGATLLVVPALLTSPSALRANIAYLAQYPASKSGLSLHAETMPNWRGFVTSVTGSTGAWLWAPGFALIALVALALAVVAWRRSSRGDPRAFALAVSLPLLLTPHLHTQSLVLLALPGALALRAWAARARADETPAMAWSLFAHVALFAAWFAATQGLALGGFVVLAAYAWLALRWPGAAATAEVKPSLSTEMRAA